MDEWIILIWPEITLCKKEEAHDDRREFSVRGLKMQDGGQWNF